MTKRILAAFLAVMMVVGILPVSVFAANGSADCAVLEQYVDHSKEHCTNAGVNYVMVPNSTVAPECGQNGYTLYQCACGAYFADDIIPMDPHKTASGEPTNARVESTCYAVGKVAEYTCDLCGKLYMNPDDLDEPNVNEKGEIAMKEHTFNDVTYPGNDCTAAEQVCQNEGCTAKNENFVPAEDHNWNYNDPFAIVKAPTEDEEGIAVFKCTNAGCAQTKEVEVLKIDHECELVDVEEKKTGEGCVTETIAAHKKCEKCGKLYDLTGAETTLEDLTTKTDHAWNVDPVIIPATCTTWGFSYYGCPNCGATKGVTPETEKDDMTKYNPLGHTPYTCETHGDVADDECATCADAALSYGYLFVAPTCEKAGEHSWYCGRCDKAMSNTTAADVLAKGHKPVTVVVPQTHKFEYTYTFTYCTNKDCCDRAAVETYTFTEGALAGITLDLTVEVREDGNVYDKPAGTGAVNLIKQPTATKKTSGFVHFYVEDKEVQAPTCTDAGKAFWYCAGENGCNTYKDEDLKPLGHDYSDTTNDIAATCTENAYKVCEVCGYEKEQAGTAKGHKMTKKNNTVLPQCDGTKGYTEYECTVCGTTKNLDQTTFVPNKTYKGVAEIVLAGVKTSLTAKEEFEMEHPGFDPANYEVYREGDCVNYGYWKAECPDCEKTYLVLIDETGNGHKIPANTVYHAEATCWVAQGYEKYVCERCQEVVENPNKPLDHVLTKTPAKAPTCTEDGNFDYWTCSRKCCKDILFKDSKANEIYGDGEHIDPAIGHNYDPTKVDVNCKTDGYTHMICLNCADEFVHEYVAPTGHTRGKDVSKKAYCEVDGCVSYLCSNAGCTGDDGIAGNEDDGIESYQILPAVGHKNSKGQLITNICTDTVADRKCKNCSWYTEWKNKATQLKPGTAEVRKDHNLTEVIEVPAGCKHYGYKMQTCANGCGEMDVVTELLDPMGHLAPWGARIPDGDKTPVAEDVCEDIDDQYVDYVIEYIEPTYEALGSITFNCCDHCGDVMTLPVIRTGLDFTFELDNANKAGENNIIGDNEEIKFYPVDGDVIAVDVYANAYETNVWGFNFAIDYTATALNYLGYVYHAEDTFGVHMLNNTVTDEVKYDVLDVDNDGIQNEVIKFVKGADGVIKFSAYTENKIGGGKVEEKLTGSLKVVTLYFQVEAYFESADFGVAKTDLADKAGLEMTEAFMANADGEAECGMPEAEFEIADILDTNDNGVFNIKDLENCYDIFAGKIEGVTYLAAADADKDGIVNISDLELMNKYLVGEISIQDLYAAQKWTAPAGFVAAK